MTATRTHTLQIDVTHDDTTNKTRLRIDYSPNRRANTLSVWDVEQRAGCELISLSSGRFYAIEQATRRNTRRLAALTEQLQDHAATIAAAYRAKQDDTIKLACFALLA